MTRTKYTGITSIKGLAVVPFHYSDDEIDAVLSDTIRPFAVQPKFIGRITYRARFTVDSNKKIIRRVLVSE